jgi:hypothetical protein
MKNKEILELAIGLYRKELETMVTMKDLLSSYAKKWCELNNVTLYSDHDNEKYISKYISNLELKEDNILHITVKECSTRWDEDIKDAVEENLILHHYYVPMI